MNLIYLILKSYKSKTERNSVTGVVNCFLQSCGLALLAECKPREIWNVYCLRKKTI